MAGRAVVIGKMPEFIPAMAPPADLVLPKK
jgi:hypothetical protein